MASIPEEIGADEARAWEKSARKADAAFRAAMTAAGYRRVTITQAQTGAAVGAQPSTGVTTATLVTLTATVTTQSNSTSGPSGTDTFFNNGTPIGNSALDVYSQMKLLDEKFWIRHGIGSFGGHRCSEG